MNSRPRQDNPRWSGKTGNNGRSSDRTWPAPGCNRGPPRSRRRRGCTRRRASSTRPGGRQPCRPPPCIGRTNSLAGRLDCRPHRWRDRPGNRPAALEAAYGREPPRVRHPPCSNGCRFLGARESIGAKTAVSAEEASAHDVGLEPPPDEADHPEREDEPHRHDISGTRHVSSRSRRSCSPSQCPTFPCMDGSSQGPPKSNRRPTHRLGGTTWSRSSQEPRRKQAPGRSRVSARRYSASTRPCTGSRTACGRDATTRGSKRLSRSRCNHGGPAAAIAVPRYGTSQTF